MGFHSVAVVNTPHKKRHITHNEYNTKEVKLSLYQAVEAYGTVRRRGSCNVSKISTNMALRFKPYTQAEL
jgi:hypothetical protein